MTSSLNVRQKQRAGIEFLVSEGEPPKKFFERLVKVYGDASIAYSTVKKWVSRIKDKEDDPSLSSLYKTDEEVEDHLQQSILETVMRLRNRLEMIAESLLMKLLNAGASPAGGQRGHCPPIFVFAPPIYFLPPTVFFWEEKFVISARKSLRISAKTFFFFEIFTETSSQSNSGTMKIWVKFNAGFQLCPPDFNFAPPRSREAGNAPG